MLKGCPTGQPFLWPILKKKAKENNNAQALLQILVNIKIMHPLIIALSLLATNLVPEF